MPSTSKLTNVQLAGIQNIPPFRKMCPVFWSLAPKMIPPVEWQAAETITRPFSDQFHPSDPDLEVDSIN